MKTKVEELTPKARRTRSALIAAAKTLIGREGTAAVNVMVVCNEASVGRTSFYNYFEDVDALIAAVALEAAADIKARFDRLHEDHPRGRERLANCLEMVVSLAVIDPETTLLLSSLAQTIPEITAMLEAEIIAELSAEPPANAYDIEPLAQYLSVTTIAIARRMALGDTPNESGHQYVRFLMKACD